MNSKAESDQRDDDDVNPRNSPRLSTPSASTASWPSLGDRRRRPKTEPNLGDAVLLSFLDGGRRPEIAAKAGEEALPTDSDDADMTSDDGVSLASSSTQADGPLARDHEGDVVGMAEEEDEAAEPNKNNMGDILMSLAAGALDSLVTAEPTPEQSNGALSPTGTENERVREKPASAPKPSAIVTQRDAPPKDMNDKTMATAVPSPFTPHSLYSPREQNTFAPPKPAQTSPTNALSPPNAHAEDLPPLHINSPRPESNSNTPRLPSIHVTLGDFKTLQTAFERGTQPAPFAHSPSTNLPRLPNMAHVAHASPPISPNEPFRREPASPAFANHPVGLTSPPFHFHRNGFHQPPDPATMATPSETPKSEQFVSTPSTTPADRDVPAPGMYVCKYPGCSAPPFQTHYLLNSHTNVHSSNRPHYCPVRGCPRGEGGKGFKRKNEMIRHGLVHDSPGYMCPFCPDRAHKYPRPDNLQRHVRVHHVDKDKDDRELREVLAQRPEGPSRRRRPRNYTAGS